MKEYNKMGFGFLRLPMKDETHLDWELINELVDLFLERGGRFFDTCYTYLDGKSEEAIKRCLVQRKERSSFILSNKLPGYMCKSYEDNWKYFNEELERCGVDYFDFYLLHWLNQENYNTAEKYRQFDFLKELKASGKAKYTGFSYHDNSSLLDRILTAHPEVDYVLIQLNYLDWDSAGIESRKCYEVCVKHGKRVMVMEPVKGGTLASLPGEAMELLGGMHPDWTPSDWALRFVQSLPGVNICLSGMNALEQVEANTRKITAMTEEESAALTKVCEIINARTKVPCTGCRYCVPHCPMDIQIPDIFKMLNEVTCYPSDDWKIKPSYRQLTAEGGAASSCVKCGCCAEHCPQHIDIPEFVEEAAKVLEK